MSGHTGGYEPPPEWMRYIPVHHGVNGEWSTNWTCRQCKKSVGIPSTDDPERDLICPECGHMIPIVANGLEKRVGDLPERERHKLFSKIKRALMWRGHDNNCRCHAAEIVREIGELLSKNGYESEEYT